MAGANRVRRRDKLSSSIALVEGLEPRRLLSSNVLTYHQDPASDGQDLTETVLTTANVNSTDFGRIFDTTLDGQVYAQPLAVANVDITRGSSLGIHDIILVATMNDSLFAIDSTSGQILWQDSFLQISNPEVTTILSPAPTTGVTPVPVTSSENALISPTEVGPELGILATPVINPATNVIYVVANTQEFRNGSTPVSSYTTGVDYHFVERLWAINLSDGSVAITPNNPSFEPASGGEVIGDTILDPTSGNTVPSFSSYTGYKYVAGPYIKGTGNNGGTNTDADGWLVNPSDTTSPWGKLGETAPQAGYIAFNAIQQMGRISLSLIDGNIFFGYASHGDEGPYYGWLLGYSATTLANTVAFNTAPTYESFAIVSGDDSAFDAQSGLWASGASVTTDGTYLYIATGNGAFNPNTDNFSSSYVSMDGTHAVQLPLDSDYGDAVLKLAIDPSANQNGAAGSTYNPDVYDPNGYGLKVVDYFVPSNEWELNKNDLDLGSGGVTLIPASGPGFSNPDGDTMLAVAGKEGRLYLLDSGNLGGFNTAYITAGDEQTNADPSPYDRVLGEYYYYESVNPGSNANNGTYKSYQTSSYFNGDIYFDLDDLPIFQISVGSLLSATSPPGSGVYTSIANKSSVSISGHGSSTTISANGTANAIAWVVDANLSSSDDLLAFNASNVATLYDSQTNASRDSLTNGGTFPGTSKTGATGVEFELPTVFNGMVYVGTGGGHGTNGVADGTLVGYGLLATFAATSANFNAPINFNAAATSTTSVQLSWGNISMDATEFEIDRSVNAGAFSVLAYVANSGAAAMQYVDSTVTAGNAYQYRIRAISGGTMTLPATGGATTESATSYATASSGTFAIQSGSTLNVYLSGAGQVFVTTSSPVTAADNGVTLSFTGVTGITVTDTASGSVLNFDGTNAIPVTFSNTANSVVDVMGGTLTFAAVPGGSINLGTLAIGAGFGAVVTAATTSQPTTLSVANLSVGSSAMLNLQNNVMLINYGTGPDPITTIAGYLKSGFNAGQWNGAGIMSSAAAVNSQNYGLGYADSADAGNPANLPSGTIEVKYTLLGDANLDGVVNGVDFGIVAVNFNKGVTGWDQGDFNYDGVDNGIDFGELAANFNEGANITAGLPPPQTNIVLTKSSGGNVATDKNQIHADAKTNKKR
jgi:hypothetical protein